MYVLFPFTVIILIANSINMLSHTSVKRYAKGHHHHHSKPMSLFVCVRRRRVNFHLFIYVRLQYLILKAMN